MATVNLGSIKFKWKGTYSGATAYTVDDVVEYNGSSYICILASTGNLPTNATYFEQMSSAGTNGTNGTDVGTVITTQGDILYRDGSGLQRLAKPSSNKFLQNTSGGVVSWETVVSKVVGIHSFTNNTRTALPSSTASRTVMWQVGNFTKEVANSKLLINVKMPLGGAGTSYPHFATTFIRFSTSSAEANGSDIFGYIHNTRAEDKGMGAILTGEFLYDTTSTNISGTGAIYITVGYHSAGGGMQPSPIWNPNATDDARSRQSISTLIVQETN
jgi:hypothetical protein